MLRSFFPNPRAFFLSALGWTGLAFVVWFAAGDALQSVLNIGAGASAEPDSDGRVPFLNPDRIWTYQYLVTWAVGFCLLWRVLSRNPWYRWSVVGSTFLVVSTYFTVQLTLWLNQFIGTLYDLIQKALTDPGAVTLEEYYGLCMVALFVLVPFIVYEAVESFITQHYLFRWRKAMNDYYMQFWPQVRHIEGAAQRVQEDTQKFARMMETLGLAFVKSVMTLIAFLPLLWTLSAQVTEYPLIGELPQGLVYVALLSAALGTVVLAAVGYRLPGLEFENQKVEAAYRKELVYGEDSPERADPPTVAELFENLRGFYFRYFFHYLYFNVARFAYLQGSVFIPLVALGPTIVAGVITFGVFQQISNAFNRVEGAFQVLVHAWTMIVELMSVYKRLRAFERSIVASDASNPPPGSGGVLEGAPA